MILLFVIFMLVFFFCALFRFFIELSPSFFFFSKRSLSLFGQRSSILSMLRYRIPSPFRNSLGRNEEDLTFGLGPHPQVKVFFFYWSFSWGAGSIYLGVQDPEIAYCDGGNAFSPPPSPVQLPEEPVTPPAAPPVPQPVVIPQLAQPLISDDTRRSQPVRSP